MKKNFKYYIVIWAVLLVLFNIISFVSVGWAEQEKYTVSFWIGYTVILLAFIGQLICAYIAFKAENAQKLFYNIPLIRVSFIGLILSFIFGGLCMLISPLPYWVGIILCAIVLAVTVISIVTGAAASDIISSKDNQIKAKTLFVKALTADAESLMGRAQSDTVKAAVKKVYEAVRYSDPVSNEALASIESQIIVKFSAFSDAVEAGNQETAETIAEELLILIDDRNKKCKLLK